MAHSTTHSLPFKGALPAVIFVTALFLCNFLSRVVLAPLMPLAQADLGFTHAGAGHLFLALAIGNALGLLFSGFVSRVLNHRRTVGLSAIMTGAVALMTPLAGSYSTLMTILFALGLAVGLYLPSGIASVTYLVRRKDWGKALAVHEMAPNLSYVIAPLLVEAMLLWADWHAPLFLLGVVQLVIGVWFLQSGRGSEALGTVPSPDMLKKIIKQSTFWILVLMFCMGVGASIGPYSMLPLYLADVHGYSREEANHLMAVSRVMACVAPFIAGWLTDRWGARPVIFLYLILNGSALVALGIASGGLLVNMVLLQPVFSVILFAPGFTILSLSFEPQERSMVIALMGPINAIVGMGLFPTFLGHMGDAGMFHTGFMVQGCLLLCVMAFLPLLPKDKA